MRVSYKIPIFAAAMKNTLNLKNEYGATLRLAIPIILSQVGQIITQLADNIMVGRLGALPLAAVSFGSTVFFFLFISSLGITLGITPIVGEAYAQGRHRDASAYLRNAIALYCGIGLMIFCVQMGIIPLLDNMGQPAEVVQLAIPYYKYLVWSLLPFMLFGAFKQFLEGIGNTTISMIIVVFSNLLNVLLNYLFIYGKWGAPEMGAVGAGVATFISRLITPFLIIGYCVVHRRVRRYLIMLRHTRLMWSKIKELLKVGFPICVQMSLEGWTFAFSSIMMGWLGTVAIAANQIAIALCNIGFLSLLGISSATTIRVSHAYGAGDYDAIKRIGASSYRIGLVWNAFTAFTFVILRNLLPQAFTNSEDVIAMTANILLVVALFQFSDGMQCIGMGILRGMQDVKITMKIAFISYLVINIPVGYILGFTLGFGEIGVWFGYIFGLSTAALLLRRRFNKNLDRVTQISE